MAQRYRVTHGDMKYTAEIEGGGLVVVDGARCAVAPAGPSRYRVTTPDGRVTLVSVAGKTPTVWAAAGGGTYDFDVDASPRSRGGARAAASDMTPPMPATVVKVAVTAGARVEAGAPVVILEAMKMELTVRASHAGVVRAVRCAVGDLVRPGEVFVEIVP